MIKFFEKNPPISWAVTIFIALVIFFVSSLTFSSGASAGNFNANLYHFVIFFLLGTFLLFSLVQGKPKKRKFILIGIVLAVFYALSDELHQLFVPGRACTFSDFIIDSLGILVAALLYLIYLRIRKPPTAA